jgi:transcriptional regulator with XRE-family HTH domain
MKLNELQRKVRNDVRFAEARKEVRKDLAFQTAHLIEGLRLSFGLSQSQFAKKVGLQQPAVARLERGGSIVPSLPMLQRIADAFDLNLVPPMFVMRGSSLIRTNSDIKSHDGALSPYYVRAYEIDHGTGEFVQAIS